MESIPRKANSSIYPSSLESYHIQAKLAQDTYKKISSNINNYETPTIRTIEKVPTSKPRVKSENQSIKGNMNQSIKSNRLTSNEGSSREKLQDHKPNLKPESSVNSINKLPPRAKIINQRLSNQIIKNQSPSQRLSPNFNIRILHSVSSDNSDTEDNKKFSTNEKALNIKSNTKTSEKTTQETNKKNAVISDITNGISPRTNSFNNEKPLGGKYIPEKKDDENSCYSNFGTRDSVKNRKNSVDASSTCSEKTEEEMKYIQSEILKYKEAQQADKKEIDRLKLNIFSLEERNKTILEEISKIENEKNSSLAYYQENLRVYKSETDNLKKALMFSEEEIRKTTAEKEALISAFEKDKRKLQEEFSTVSSKNESSFRQEINKLKEEKTKNELIIANLTNQLEKPKPKPKSNKNSEILNKTELLNSEISKLSHDHEQLKAYLLQNIQAQYNFFTLEINKLQTSYESNLQKKIQPTSYSDDLEIYKRKCEDLIRQNSAIQKNNSDIAGKLQQVFKELEAYKEKSQKDQKEWYEEKNLMTYKIECLDKQVHSCTDPEKMIYEAEIKELERNCKISSTKLFETEKELRFWKTGVKDSQEEHIKDLEAKIFMLSDERDELKRKLLISLES